MHYNANRRISFVNDNLGHEILFAFNNIQLVESVSTSAGNKAIYSYKIIGTIKVLSASSDIGNNKFKYNYNPKGYMNEIEYGDKSVSKIVYDDNSRVIKEINPDGSFIDITYKDRIKGKDLHYKREAKFYTVYKSLEKTINKEFYFTHDDNNHLVLRKYDHSTHIDASNGNHSKSKVVIRTSGLMVDPNESIFDDFDLQ